MHSLTIFMFVFYICQFREAMKLMMRVMMIVMVVII